MKYLDNFIHTQLNKLNDEMNNVFNKLSTRQFIALDAKKLQDFC